MKTNNVSLYLNEMNIVKELFEKGILNEDDYRKAEAHLAKKHCIKDKSIYRLNMLINKPNNVINIGGGKEPINEHNNDHKTVTKID